MSGDAKDLAQMLAVALGAFVMATAAILGVIAVFLGVFLIPFIIFATVICAPILGIEYYGSCQEARVFNAEHNTNWTCWDFFWAGEQINDETQTVRIR